MAPSRSKINAALRSLLAKRPRPLTALATIDRFDRDNQSTDYARGVILVSAALAEQLLEEAILTRCLKKFTKPPYRDVLFSGDPESGGAVTTFAAKITLGHALGLYGNLAREDFDRLRRVRNVAAHAKTKLTFESPAIKNAVQSLHILGEAYGNVGKSRRARTTKAKFLASCAMSMIFLYFTVRNSRRFRPRLGPKRAFFYD
jgi:hypothetical protein